MSTIAVDGGNVIKKSVNTKRRKLKPEIKLAIKYAVLIGIWAVSLFNTIAYFTGMLVMDIQFAWYVHWLAAANTAIMFVAGAIIEPEEKKNV
jgi:hypothetical protein